MVRLATLLLPRVEVISYLSNLLRRELDVLLLKGLSPLAQIHKEHLSLPIAILHQRPILIDGACLLIPIQYPQGDTDICGVKHIAGQYHDRLYQLILYQLLADRLFCTLTAERSIGEEKARHTMDRELGDNVEDPTVIGIARRGYLVASPARIVYQFVFGTPRLLIEGGIGHDEVRLEVFVLIIVKGVSSYCAQIGGDTTYGEVHLRQLVGRIGILLTIDRDILLITVVRLDKLHALHKHTARTAARVVYLPLVGLYHLGNQIDDALRGVVLPLALTLGDGELAEEILIDTSYQVVLTILERVDLIDLVQEG